MPTKQKVAVVAKLRASFEKSQSIIVTEYRGVTVKDLETLRRRLDEVGAEYRVVKNRLAKLALQQAGLNTLDDHLVEMRGIVIGLKDPVAPAKVVVQFAKENDKLKIHGGLMENLVLDTDGVKQLSETPSREELLGRFLGSVQSPIQKLAYGLNQTIAKVAYAVDAVARKKEENAA